MNGRHTRGGGLLQISGDGADLRIFGGEGGLNFRFRDFFGWENLTRQVFFWIFKAISRFVLVPAYDNFRWYDKETNTNIPFLMFFTSCYSSFNTLSVPPPG